MSSDMLQPLSMVYGELFADNYGEVLIADNLRSYYNLFQDLDPNNFMRFLFLDPISAGAVVRRQADTDTIFCKPPSSALERREKNGFLVDGLRHKVSGWRDPIACKDQAGRNARDGFRCREDGSVWYIGSPRDLPTQVQDPRNQVYFDRLQASGRFLFQSGYVSSEALGLITTVSADDWLWHSTGLSGSKTDYWYL